jgi:hypothetical protein
MTIAIKILNVSSSFFGLIGTYILFKGSFAFETMPHYMSTQLATEMSVRNAKRNRHQKCGVFFLVLSFILLILAQFL